MQFNRSTIILPDRVKYFLLACRSLIPSKLILPLIYSIYKGQKQMVNKKIVSFD